jgi:hypothetical protein
LITPESVVQEPRIACGIKRRVGLIEAQDESLHERSPVVGWQL